MKRDLLTKKLVRILEALNREKFILKIKKLYAFGSYARGALEPGDLDLLLLYEYPDDHAARARRATEKASGSFMERIFSVDREYKRNLMGKLRKPGEKIELLAKHVNEFDAFVGKDALVKPDDLVLLWEENDRNWQSKLAALTTNAEAGRAPRNHLISMRRTRDMVNVMEKTVEAIESGVLTFTRIPMDDLDIKLDANHQQWIERWRSVDRLGKKSTELLPYAMWWLQRHRQRRYFPYRTTICSQNGSHRVQLGRLSFHDMLCCFEKRDTLKRQCLIAHRLSSGQNDLLCFERGPNWADRSKHFFDII